MLFKIFIILNKEYDRKNRFLVQVVKYLEWHMKY